MRSPPGSIRLLAGPAHESCGVVRIAVGTDVKDYVVLPVPSDYEPRGFRLAEILGEHEGCRVCLSEGGGAVRLRGLPQRPQRRMSSACAASRRWRPGQAVDPERGGRRPRPPWGSRPSKREERWWFTSSSRDTATAT